MVNVVVSGVPIGPATRCFQLHGASIRVGEVARVVSEMIEASEHSFMLLCNGRSADDSAVVAYGTEECVFLEFRFRRALPGGKGGFGAMLRGANASKKTTNFGACRDLSGRRLRDLEHEKELANSVQHASDNAPDQKNLGAGSADQALEDTEEKSSVDIEEVKADMEAATEVVEDAVAEGIRAARLRKKSRKRKRSESVASKRNSCRQRT